MIVFTVPKIVTEFPHSCNILNKEKSFLSRVCGCIHVDNHIRY